MLIIIILTSNSYSDYITTNYKLIIVPILLNFILFSKVLPLIKITYTVNIKEEGQLIFTPNNITAGVGNIVFFFFYKLNYTLI